MLTKQRHVLERLVPHEAATTMPFVRDEEPHLSVELRMQDWRDMGEPDEITITVEPGDKLNEES